MLGAQFRSIAGAAAVATLLTTASEARPIVVPFDFSQREIGLTVSVHGTPLFMMLDTGVSPSAIDTARAKSLGLKIDFAGGGEGSGAGNAKHVFVYPTSIENLKIAHHRFGSVEALAIDYTAISHAMRRPVDGTLGYSFLKGRVVLIDYPARTITIAGRQADVAPELATCRRAWRKRLRSFKGDTIPIVGMKLADTPMPVSIDTGSNGGVELFKHALDIPAIKAALVQTGTAKQTGARGGYTAKVYRLNAPISLGPFDLPAGQRVTFSGNKGSATTRLANVGNRVFADMNIKLLLDYRGARIGFYGDCAK